MPAFASKTIQGAVTALLCFLAMAFSAPAADFRSEPLEIRRADGKVLHFTVELATTDEERRVGLMNRDEMKTDHGMLFDFGESRDVYMWMKNTYLPLDMLFISDTGRIETIRADTLPLSEDIISSGGPVRFVLEIFGGVSDTLGIKPGDVVASDQVRGAAPRP